MLKLKKKNLNLNGDREFASKCIKESKKRLKEIKLMLKEKEYSKVLAGCHGIFEFCGEGILRSAGIVPEPGGFIWIQVGGFLEKLSDYRKEYEEHYDWAEFFTIHEEINFYQWLNTFASESDKKNDAKKAIKGAIFSLKLLEKISGIKG